MNDEARPDFQPYTLERILASDQTFLARDARGKRVVLKILADDCMTGSMLHPLIKLRLQRLRELPLTQSANLLGVERISGKSMLVSEFIEGTPLDEYTGMDSQKLLKELRIIIESMHQFGLVHGSIHGGNVLVDASGHLHLIDASPYLYDDPQVDLNALCDLQKLLNNEPSEDHKVVATTQDNTREDNNIRQRAMVGALLLIVMAILIGGAVAFWISHGRGDRL